MKKSTIIFSAANLVGLFLYLCFVASIVSFAKTEQRDYYDFGDNLNFIGTALPTFLLCLLLNIFWGTKSFIEIFRRRDYRSGVACAIAVAVWATVILIVKQFTGVGVF